MKFSIIIPTLNEQTMIKDCLLALQVYRAEAELIVVDGGSHDATYQMAQSLADKVLKTAAGRALQMNAGAACANGEILIFLHADTQLPCNALARIAEGLNPTTGWGRFDIALQGTAFVLKIIAWMMNWRSRLTGIATGDQVIFVRKTVFEQLGAYPDLALMEDIALSARLKKYSKPLCLKDKVISSGRRWERFGILSTILLMWGLRLGYFLGIDTKTLARIYYRS